MLNFLLIFISINPNFKFDTYLNYGIKDGIPSSTIYDLEFDNNGSLWLVTKNGLCKLNGDRIKGFKNLNSLDNNEYLEVFKDGQGHLWFIGTNNEIYKYDTVLNLYKYNHLLSELFKKPQIISDFYVDNKNNVHISAKGIGYVKINNLGEINVQNQNFLIDQCIKYINDTTSLFMNLENYEDGHSLLLDQSFKINVDKNLNGRPTLKLSNNTIIFTIDYYNLYKHNGKKLSLIFKSKSKIIRIKKHENFYLLSTSRGIIKLDSTFKIVQKYLENFYSTGIAVDKQNNFWVSTFNNGIFFIPNNEIFLSANDLKIQKTLIIDSLRMAIVDNNGFLTVFKENIPGKTLKLYCNNIRNLFVDNGNICYSCGNHFTYKILNNDSTIKFHPLFNNFTVSKETKQFHIGFAKFMNEETYYVINTDLYVRKSNQNRILLKNIGKDKVLDIIKFKDFYYIVRPDRISKFKIIKGSSSQHNLGDFIRGKFNFVQHINNSKLILSKNNGLLIICNNETTHLNKANGLIENKINAISSDHLGNIWLGTNSGLQIISSFQNTNKSIVINKELGLISNFIKSIDIINKMAFISTDNGMQIINLNDLEHSIHSINPRIETIEIVTRNYKNENLLDYISNYKTTELKLSSNSIINRSNFKIVYKLFISNELKYEGTSFGNNLTFNKLRPEKYSLSIFKDSSSKQTISNEAQIDFVIKNSFIHSRHFQLIILILLILLFYEFQNGYRNTNKSLIKFSNSLIKDKYYLTLQVLRSQMNPHFIFNSLNSINVFISSNHSRIAQDFLKEYSALMREILEYSSNHFIPLVKEIEILEKYLKIEQQRFKNFDYKIITDKKLDLENEFIPPFLLQPFVENSILHGLGPLKSSGKLLIKIIKGYNGFVVTIIDNGIGRINSLLLKKGESARHKSFGTKITKDQIKMINIVYDLKVDYRTIDLYRNKKPKGTLTEISINTKPSI